jgi:hypothetical protein
LCGPASLAWCTLGGWQYPADNFPLLVAYIHGICKKWLTDGLQFTTSFLAL